jgi:hypothetical protein
MTDDILKPIDYGTSYISGKWLENTVRFWVESRMRFIDEKTKNVEDYYQCGSCKSEYTFVEKNLFMVENYDFIPIFGPVYGITYRRKAYLTANYKSCPLAKDMWEGQNYKLKEPKSFIVLDSNSAVREATNDAMPIVAQTEIYDKDTGLRAIIEYPVKTMNINDSRDLYQVDTGPVLLPDLSKRYEKTVDSIQLAFAAFNVPHFTDFVIETATSIGENGTGEIKVLHYSEIKSLPARNTLFALTV